MRQFRIVTVVNSPDLGDVLGDLQERGCEVQACNVISQRKEVERAPAVLNQDKLLLTDTDDIHAVVADDESKYPTTAGAVMRTLAGLPKDTRFTCQMIVDILVKQGFNKYTVRRAFFKAAHNSRFSRLGRSIYVVADTTKSISYKPPKYRKRLPKGYSQIAREFLLEYLRSETPDKKLSRQEMMKVGERNGYNYHVMNAAVQAMYERGYLERVNMGVYRNKSNAPLPPPIRQTKEDHAKKDQTKEELNAV